MWSRLRADRRQGGKAGGGKLIHKGFLWTWLSDFISDGEMSDNTFLSADGGMCCGWPGPMVGVNGSKDPSEAGFYEWVHAAYAALSFGGTPPPPPDSLLFNSGCPTTYTKVKWTVLSDWAVDEHGRIVLLTAKAKAPVLAAARVRWMGALQSSPKRRGGRRHHCRSPTTSRSRWTS